MSEIYIHIPFCNSKCIYCDFLSGKADESVHSKLTDAMCRELYYRKNMINDNITSIFIGGGTPSSVSSALISRLLDAVYQYYSVEKEAEITLESNPGTLTLEKLSAYKNIGINRLSMGLQSSDDDELKMLGRIHTFGEFLKNYDLARETGFDNINIDIMQSLPFQTADKYKKTLERVISLRPEHISSYSLIVEEGTPLFNRTDLLKHLPDEDTEREIYYLTNELLSENGYIHYEISNYALESRECKHNLGYWNRDNYIGIGVGASSLVRDFRFANIRDINRYTELTEYYSGVFSEQSWIDKDSIEELSEKDKMSEFMYLGLRKTDGICSATFNNEFNICIEEIFGDVLNKYIDLELMKRTDKGYALTDRGVDISNYVLADFILE
ncbi:MAG: radical SAM family heme chaperone HemW [Lachnospiraceae bacterium]|nr:radical SAM family heme chaperone HemW [Lachnospiraceae bacterium]